MIGLVLFIILCILGFGILEYRDIDFEKDKAYAMAENYCIYRKALSSLSYLELTDFEDPKVLTYIKAYHINYKKIKPWKYLKKDGKIYVYIESSQLNPKHVGLFENQIIENFLDNSAFVGHKDKDGNLQRSNNSTTINIKIPDEIPIGSILSII